MSSLIVLLILPRSRLQKPLDSYQEDDLNRLRDKWSEALLRRRNYLDQQIKRLINKQGLFQLCCIEILMNLLGFMETLEGAVNEPRDVLIFHHSMLGAYEKNTSFTAWVFSFSINWYPIRAGWSLVLLREFCASQLGGTSVLASQSS